MKKNFLSDSVRSSAILTFLRTMMKFVSRSFDNSLAGAFASSGKKISNLYRSSFSSNLFAGQTRRNSPLKKALRFVASGFEGSFLVGVFKKGYAAFLNMKLRSAGFFLSAYSLFSIFAMAVIYLSTPEDFVLLDLVAVLAVAVVSIPLMCTGKSVIDRISASRFLGPIIRKNFGIDTKKKARDVAGAEFPERLSGFSLVFGIVAGTLTVFISPFMLIIGMLAVIAVMFIVAIPEAGVIAIISAIPLYYFFEYGHELIFSLIIVTFVGYIGKLIRGKRMFNVSLTGVAVLSLFVILFTSCFGNAVSYDHIGRMVGLMLTYFLFVNVIRERVWLKRAVMALVFSWIMTAFIGVLIPIFENTPYISSILPEIGSEPYFFVFGNPSGAVYLLLPALPFLFAVISNSSNLGKRMALGFFAIIIGACLTIGGNSMPFTALITGLFIYFLCTSPTVVFAGFPIWLSALALNGINIPIVSDMIRSSAEYAENLAFENRYIRGGVVRALGDYFFTGIGMGDETFSKVYPNYSYAGFEGAVDSGSSFFDFFLGTGIIGILLFAAVIVIFLREALGFIRRCKAKDRKADRRYVAAAFSGVIMLAIASFFDNIYSTETVFLYLWLMIAFGVSYIRMSDTEEARAEIRHLDTPDRADARMPFVRVRNNETNSN